MKKMLAVAVLLMLSVGALGVDVYFSDNRQAAVYKKGLTFTTTVWPEEANSYVGRMSCNDCDPQEGDTPCTEKLPVLCIIHHKVLNRPYYNFYPDFSSYDNADQGYYEGWTGGIFALTDPVRGLEVDSFVTGDHMCKLAYGPNAKFATFRDGFYMDNMNGPDLKIERSWDWGKAKAGEYGLWGYFNHDHVGKSWIWTQYTPKGNCVIPSGKSTV